MFLKVKANNFISYGCGVVCQDDIEKVSDEFLINLSQLSHITIKKCSININKTQQVTKLKQIIEFDRYVEEGVLNYINLFFKSREDKEFKRIMEVINTCK